MNNINWNFDLVDTVKWAVVYFFYNWTSYAISVHIFANLEGIIQSYSWVNCPILVQTVAKHVGMTWMLLLFMFLGIPV